MKDSLARPPPYEEELRIAVAEGLVSEADAPALEEEARRVGKGPLALLHAHGRISDATLAALMPRAGAALEASTMAPLTPAASPSQAAPPFPLPRWDRYQGLRFLGQGGMGQVFLAYDPRLRRDVALKFMKGDDPDVLRRLLAEARAQARVHHERVCPVHEMGEAQGRAFIAMRYIPGRTLGQLAETLTVAQQVRLVREAALGVHAAHLAGLIHRDLKPGNILVERTADGRLHPYVMDFGLAHDWTARGATATGSVLGTPPYMSPEQARGEVGQLDRRTDVYSLGATLYHLLTGQPPIPGANGLEVLSRIATVEPVPPRTLRPDVPADLEAIVLKCLEKDRAARYDSALALAEDLDRFLEDRPVLARPVSLGSRLRKKARRNRVAVSVAAVALVAVLGALVQVQLTRRQAAHRELLSRRFTEAVERVEAQVRYTSMARLHDVRAERAELRHRLEALAGDVALGGEEARGPGLYALGRGTLALGDPAKAREQLEAAWEAGFHEPRLAWSLALALGQLYRDALLDVENVQDPERRKSRLAATQREYRDPALLWLRRSEGAEVPSPDYVAALLAFHEDRWDDALARLDAAEPLPPWFFEAPLLRGDILQARAHQRWNQGDRDGARADLDAGRRVLASAAATGESLPEVQLALARLEYRALVMALYSQGDVEPAATHGLEAVARALAADADSAEAHTWEARFHNRRAEDSLRRGADPEDSLQRAIAAARQVLATRPSDSRARKELAQSLLREARAKQGRGMPPDAPLQGALEALDGIDPRKRDHEVPATRGLIFRVWADADTQRGASPSEHQALAIAAYRQALQLDAALPDVWINLGQLYLTRASDPRAATPDADLDEARRALEQARRLNPTNFVAWFLGGTLHTELASRSRTRGGDPRPDLETAATLFERGITINARVAPLHNGLGIVRAEQAREAWDRGEDPFPFLDAAQAAYAKAVEAAPRQGWGQNNTGDVHFARAEWRDALGEAPDAEVRAAQASYEEAVALLPGQATPWANLARLHLLQATRALARGRPAAEALSRAGAALDEALRRNPEEPLAWRLQAELASARARALPTVQADAAFTRASSRFDAAMEREPRSLETRLAFARMCLAWAQARKAAGQDAAPVLARGLEAVDALLALHADWAEARWLRASLRLTREPDLPEALQERAAAIAANPHLAGRGPPSKPAP
ncbi:serine/threonine-protein kinase [Corallococcus sp. Z5C101001]|uniref:serine/threonine-protein kinase n=1 Tax=Corallococcus sp. Z5C101001 TaxID=2596829 RepID=UPI00117D7ABE|nr:serine/threonine-protein kinase [Corallococcus sp. Z5C101001]TSC25243.1 protein kinase [Corallococcus sp. Z5C101001]